MTCISQKLLAFTTTIAAVRLLCRLPLGIPVQRSAVTSCTATIHLIHLHMPQDVVILR